MTDANKPANLRDDHSLLPHSVTLVISHLTPVLGMEATVLSLANALKDHYVTRIITIAEGKSTTPPPVDVEVESWGSKVVGWKRALTIRRVLKHRNSIDSDVVILCGVWAALPTLLTLPKPVRRKCIIWEHSFDSQKVKTSRSLALLRTVARYVYRRSAGTVAVSTSLMRDMQLAGFDGVIDVIPNLTRDLGSPAPSAAVPGTLLTVGSLSKTKNQRLAVQMMAHLPQAYSLDLLGAGPDMQALKQLAAYLGVSDRVRFHGYVSDPAPYFERCQMLVHTSLGETFGLVLFESAAFERPVVAVNRSVMVDIVPVLVPGILAEPEPEAFAAAVSSLQVTPIAHDAFAAAAKRRQETADLIVGQWSSVLTRVVASA
jgi:glycosyltransferase involved in cell wall biosynthesis